MDSINTTFTLAQLKDGLDAVQRGDFATALRLLTPLAAQGHASAQSNLGFMYAAGQGVAQDAVRAHMWLNIAAASLNEEDGKKVATIRDEVAKKMPPRQIERALEMARKCQASNFKNCD